MSDAGAAPVARSEPPYATVVFDCDSTLSEIEGIEELIGEHPEVIRLTKAAMDGTLPLEEVYGRRLELVRPTRSDLERVGQLYIETAVEGAAELVEDLRALGKRVLIVSGGLLPAVRDLARALGVPAEDAHAVGVHFDERGGYAGFEEDSPLARRGGKPDLLARLIAEGLPTPIALVGDGATDLEAAPLCARFVAFTGIEHRDAVVAGADAVCDEASFDALRPLLLTEQEQDGLIPEA